MPAMLTRNTEKEWLNPDIEGSDALKLLTPYKDSEMISFPISTLVNSPKNDVLEILTPAMNSK